MRLIDRDEAIGVVIMNLPVNTDDEEYKRGFADGIVKAVSCLKMMPVVHTTTFKIGKWKTVKRRGPELSVCSVCGNTVSLMRGEADRYCSECGAQMFVRDKKVKQ